MSNLGGPAEMPAQRRTKSRFSDASVDHPSRPYSACVPLDVSVPPPQYNINEPVNATFSTGPSPSTLPIVGKRKMGGRVLKTGVLTADKKQKTEGAPSTTSNTSTSKGAPSMAYLEEMKKYSEQLCTEERHARPLVK